MRLANATLNHLQSTVWPALENGYGLPPRILNAVATWETRGTFDNDAYNRGSGARGIFQITPIALKQINIDTGMTLNPTNPYQASVAAGVLLARASRLFSGELPLMLIAYNAGEGRARRFIRAVAAEGSGQLPKETLDYISNVTQLMG
jgi:soluble lytic murein transglycosylase-like protein